MKDRGPRPRTSELLAAIAAEPGDSLPLGELLDRFAQRAFGVMLILVTLPSFIPLPMGMGAISGPLIVLLGLQMTIGLSHPWLPQWLQRRPVRRETIARFLARIGKGLERMERLCRPRLLGLTVGLGERIGGLLLIGLGLAVSLPVPFTNYPLGVLAIAFAIAIIERDGAWLLGCWIGCAVVVAIFVGVGDALLTVAAPLFGR